MVHLDLVASDIPGLINQDIVVRDTSSLVEECLAVGRAILITEFLFRIFCPCLNRPTSRDHTDGRAVVLVLL